MPLVLCRVDDRLVHGQVVIGWGQRLGVQRIVVVDDAVAASPWEQDLYRMAVAPGVTLDFASVADAAVALTGWAADARRTILLTGEVEAMAALHRADPAVMRRINLGGIHFRPGRTERLPYVFLSPEEYSALVALAAAGADVTAQDVPTATSAPLATLA